MKKLLLALVLLAACYRDSRVTKIRLCNQHTDCNVTMNELCIQGECEFMYKSQPFHSTETSR